MKYYVYVCAASGMVHIDAKAEARDLWCAKVVLQHEGGVVGFGRGGAAAMRSLVGDVVVIEYANSPGWSRVDAASLSGQFVHSRFKKVATCSEPRRDLLVELEGVSKAQTLARKNEILSRHGKPPIPVGATIFDDWILPGDRMRQRVAAWLIDRCELLVLWPSSAWGLHAIVLGHSERDVMDAVIRAGGELNVPVIKVRKESDLPVW